ncbi:hypothetical protein H8959_001584 [Pygathrix nigripes]
MTPDLLNFKKGWMSILDEPGEPPSPSLTTTSTSQWKKHWFVLTDSSLKYYRDSTAEEADELDGEIDLRSCTDVTEYAVQRNYGFQIHTKDAVYTLSAMTSGIRRNWIEALRKTVRPTSAPDVTKLSDSNKENALHNYGTQKGPLKAGEQRAGVEVISRGGPRKADGQRQALDYVELSPLTQASPQRARTPARTPDRLAKQEELERDLAQRSEERRKWFEATDSRTSEVPAGEGLRRGLGAPLTEDQQNRLSEEIEKKWQELEKLPLRENKRVPLTALLNQSRGERRGPPSDSHEALEKEVQALRAQLEAWRLQGEAPQSAPRSQEDGHIPPGYISQEAILDSLDEAGSLLWIPQYLELDMFFPCGSPRLHLSDTDMKGYTLSLRSPCKGKGERQQRQGELMQLTQPEELGKAAQHRNLHRCLNPYVLLNDLSFRHQDTLDSSVDICRVKGHSSA